MAELSDYKEIYIERELSDDELMWVNLLNNASSFFSGLNINYEPSPLLKLAKGLDDKAKFMTELNDPMASYVLCMECTMVD